MVLLFTKKGYSLINNIKDIELIKEPISDRFSQQTQNSKIPKNYYKNICYLRKNKKICFEKIVQNFLPMKIKIKNIIKKMQHNFDMILLK